MSLDQAIRCSLVQEEPGRWLIVVNRRLPEEQQEEACAHALGHWALHRDLRSVFVCGPANGGEAEEAGMPLPRTFERRLPRFGPVPCLGGAVGRHNCADSKSTGC